MKIYRISEGLPGFRDDIPYADRIREKEEYENTLWGRIEKEVPWVIEVSSTGQDMAGIDATAVGLKNGQSISPKTIQLKMRQSGDDVLMETVKPFIIDPYGDLQYDGLTGRDMKVTVDMYFCVDTQMTLRIFSGSTLKNVATTMTESFVQSLKRNPNQYVQRFPEGEARVVKDPSAEANYSMGKVSKIVVFINPLEISPIYTLSIA